MDFQTAVKTVLLKKYADFNGRARRSELWWFALFSFGVNVILSIIDGALFGGMGGQVSVLGGLWSLAVLLPSLAVGARRLHDIGRSGWWLLIVFIPLIGALVLIYWYVQQGDDGPNEYGADPIAA